MNALVDPFVIAFALYSGYSWAVGHKPNHSVLLSWNANYLLQCQVQQRLIGGTVEVFDENENLVRSEKIQRLRSVVDFFMLSPGKYAIKVRKDQEVHDFTYVRQA